MMRPLALALCGLAAPLAAQAEQPLTAAEFEARVTGLTLSYENGGRPYGAERYEPGRRVTWSDLDGDCLEGEWFEQAGEICFAYEDGTPLQCWRFYDEGGSLRAVFSEAGGTTLYHTETRDEPLECRGPEVGV
ncbi:hypothetical protein [Pseudoroseicyclus aestuarii]|uniref:MORN repeat protein n=1 Tax=Pseudoroseicyclus aestuarii TaxID=1795041 RepID=A0A318SWF4_9RHOB|nr:hypothetical protein [Pseudoroseicyclus aestuarii]PYE85832.1 hypothetical protein DFP88_101505 [Pseudoroseicyclus aestuarii]